MLNSIIKNSKVKTAIFLILGALLLILFSQTLKNIGISISDEPNELRIKDIGAKVNETNVKVLVSLDNEDSFAGLQFEINHPDFLLFKGIEMKEDSRFSNAFVEVGNETGMVRVAILGNISNDNRGNDDLMNLIFDVSPEAVPGNYEMDFSQVFLTDLDINHLRVEAIRGIFEVKEEDEEDLNEEDINETGNEDINNTSNENPNKAGDENLNETGSE